MEMMSRIAVPRKLRMGPQRLRHTAVACDPVAEERRKAYQRNESATQLKEKAAGYLVEPVHERYERDDEGEARA